MWYEWTILGLLYVIVLGVKAWCLCGLALAQNDTIQTLVKSREK
ncbi:hypothetical protein [Vibrio sp. 10N.247.310.17]